jgi:hypothetical protein
MTFTIIQTRTTPFAEFRDGYLIIRGKSVPFDHPEIYDIIMDRLKLFAQTPDEEIQIDIKLTAVNAVSKRSIANTFICLENLEKKGTRVKINWFYPPDNEDIFELGEIFQSRFTMMHIILQTCA